jgi:hypothetical protein
MARLELSDADWVLEGVPGELTGRHFTVLSDALNSLAVLVLREPARTYVFDGPLSGFGALDQAISTIEPSPSRAWNPGDLNSDCWVDLLLGGPNFAAGADPESTGAVLFFANPLPLVGSYEDASAVFSTQDSSEEFGQSVAAGDFNGDGLVDLFIGAPSAEGGGRVYLFEDSLSDHNTADADATWGGLQAGSSLGYAIAVGDLDQDGLADVVIGGPLFDDATQSDAGHVVIVPGTTWPDDNTLLTQGMVITGGMEEAFLGFSVAITTNFTGNGEPGLALGAPGYSTESANYCGAVAVFSGLPVGTQRLQDAQLLATGEFYGQNAGSVLAVGLLGSDSLGDIAVG